MDAQGRDLNLSLDSETALSTTLILELTKASQTFRFSGIASKPTPSLLRNFSAPVVLEYDYTDEELGHLLANDSDPFNRWEAGQRLAMRRVLKLTAAVQQGEVLELDAMFINALRATLNDSSLDPSFREVVMTLPSEAMIAEELKIVDPQSIHTARQFMRVTLTHHLKADLLRAYEENLTPGKYSPDAASAAKRALKNLALSYLLEWPDDATFSLAKAQFDQAENMTDRMAALTALSNFSGSAKNAKAAEHALQKFYKNFKKEALVIDKWFMLQATARTTDVRKVRELMQHKAFTLSNPNRARSLIFGFCNANPSRFHAADGSGYVLWADMVIALNKLNPQVAARLARSMDRWKKYPQNLQLHMKAALVRVSETKKLSKDVLEIVSKALAS